MTLPRKIALIIIPLLGACASATGAAPITTVPQVTAEPVGQPSAIKPEPSKIAPPARSPRQFPPITGGFRPPRIMNLPGADGVIGATVESLTNQFGVPRLNVREGDALKLQFTGASCVLDIYLYPKSPGATPTATYVDARRASDGLDVDRVSCIQSLRGY